MVQAIEMPGKMRQIIPHLDGDDGLFVLGSSGHPRVKPEDEDDEGKVGAKVPQTTAEHLSS
jgi:hypothetical protein